MPFSRPSVSEIIDRIKSDIETRLSTGRLIQRSFLSIMSTAYGGAVHLLHGHIQWASRQIIPDTADDEYLVRWASIWGIERTAASFAAGSAVFTGTNGTTIPEGPRHKRSDGVFYVTTSSGVIASEEAIISIKATNAGVDGNAVASSSLSMVTPIAGVNTATTVEAAGITNGADSESDNSLRARLLERIQQPPHGGALFDYETWAKEVNGVTRAWPYKNGTGAVSLTFVLDGEADIIPDAAKVQEVQDYIDSPTRRPVTANFTAFAPTAVPLDFTISVSPNTADVQAAVTTALQEMITRNAEPGGTIFLSKIREAVSIAAGEDNNTVTAPSGDVTHNQGEIAIFGTISWA